MLLCLKREPFPSTAASTASASIAAAASHSPSVAQGTGRNSTLHLMHLSWIALDFEQYARFLSAHDPLGVFQSHGIQICEPFLSVHFDRIVGLFAALHAQRIHLQLEEAYKRYFARFSPFHDVLADDSKGRFDCLWRRGTVSPEVILEKLTMAVASYPHPDWHFVVRQVTRTWMYDLLQRWDAYGSIEDWKKKDLFLSLHLDSKRVAKINCEISGWDSKVAPREFVTFLLQKIHGKVFWINGELGMYIGKTDRMLKANYLPLVDPDYYALVVWRLQRLGIGNFEFASRYFEAISTLARFNVLGTLDSSTFKSFHSRGKDTQSDYALRQRLRYFESRDAVTKVKNVLKLIASQNVKRWVGEGTILDHGFHTLEQMLAIASAIEQGDLPPVIWANVQALRRALKKCKCKGPLDPLFLYNKNGEQVMYLLYRWATLMISPTAAHADHKMASFAVYANETLMHTFRCPYEHILKKQVREQWFGYCAALLMALMIVAVNVAFVWSLAFEGSGESGGKL